MKDVHTEHCCLIHGCKYHRDDTCTVMTKAATQSFACEQCDHDASESKGCEFDFYVDKDGVLVRMHAVQTTHYTVVEGE